METSKNNDLNIFSSMRKNVEVYYINSDKMSLLNGIKKAYIDPSNTFIVFETEINNGHGIHANVAYYKLSEIRHIFSFDD